MLAAIPPRADLAGRRLLDTHYTVYALPSDVSFEPFEADRVAAEWAVAAACLFLREATGAREPTPGFSP